MPLPPAAVALPREEILLTDRAACFRDLLLRSGPALVLFEGDADLPRRADLAREGLVFRGPVALEVPPPPPRGLPPPLVITDFDPPPRGEQEEEEEAAAFFLLFPPPTFSRPSPVPAHLPTLLTLSVGSVEATSGSDCSASLELVVALPPYVALLFFSSSVVV